MMQRTSLKHKRKSRLGGRMEQRSNLRRSLHYLTPWRAGQAWALEEMPRQRGGSGRMLSRPRSLAYRTLKHSRPVDARARVWGRRRANPRWHYRRAVQRKGRESAARALRCQSQDYLSYHMLCMQTHAPRAFFFWVGVCVGGWVGLAWAVCH